MPRIRTIKPEITTDEKLASVSRDSRLTFLFAISQADDDGLLPGNPRQLLAALFPVDDTVTDKILAYWLKELVDIGLCRWRATLQGARVLELVNWEKHQKIDHKGKSLLRPNLRDAGEEVESGSRESREDVARVSRSDLGPRTLDHGPRTVCADKPRGARPRREPAPWMGLMAGAWSLGSLPPGSATQLQPVVAAVGPEEAAERLGRYCAQVDSRFASLRDFVAKHAAYASQGRVAVDPVTGLPNAIGIAALGGR